jgi:hypothetical protein
MKDGGYDDQDLAAVFSEDVPVAMARQRCPEVQAVLQIVEIARAVVDTKVSSEII